MVIPNAFLETVTQEQSNTPTSTSDFFAKTVEKASHPIPLVWIIEKDISA